MTLDYETQQEIENRIERYGYFKENGLTQTQLDNVKQRDVTWIRRVCESEDYQVDLYLDYYAQGVEG